MSDPIRDILDQHLTDRPEPWADACRLVAVVHTTRDRQTWTGISYWEQLPARVLIAARSASTVGEWWQQMCVRMGCTQPAKREDRQLLAGLIATDDQTEILAVLDTERDALAVTVRAAWDIHHQDRRDTTPTDDHAQETML